MADETQTREMPADMKAVMDQIMAGITDIGKRVKALETEPPEHEPGVADGGKTAEMLRDSKAPSLKTIKETYAQEQANTLKAYLRNEIGADQWKAHNQEVAKHDAELNAAFNKVVHSWKGNNNRALETYNDLAEQNDYIKASLVEGTASLGGNLVPQLYGNQLVAKLKEASIVRKAGAYQFPVSGGYKFQVPTISRSGSAPIASELGAASQMEPTFGTVDFQAYSYRAQYIASREQVLDSRLPLDSILMDNAAYQFTQSENNHFAIGTGSSQPQGIAKAASVSAASPGSTAALALANPDNIIDTYYSLPYQYRDNAVWFANDAVIKVIRKTKWATTTGAGSTTTYNQYLWQPGLDVGRPDTLLGRPIYPLNNMYTDGSGAGSTTACLVIANMDFFWIADFYNGGLDFQVLNELYAASAGIGWWFWKRMDSHLVIAEAAQGLAFRS